jgi:hypothetical protein
MCSFAFEFAGVLASMPRIDVSSGKISCDVPHFETWLSLTNSAGHNMHVQLQSI